MSKEPNEAVREVLAVRRQRALAEAEQRRQCAYAKAPALYEIDGRMAQTAMEIASAALSHRGEARLEEIKARLMALQSEKAALLGTIGQSIDDLQPQFCCAACQDTGYAGGHRCACWDELYRQEAGKRLPEWALDGQCSFANFRLDYYPERDEKGHEVRRTMERILALCVEYANKVGDRAGNLLFVGKTGLGKTHLSLAIAAQAAQRGCLVRYSSAQGIIDRFERTRFGRSPTAEDWDFVAEVGGAGLLIIDDLGSEFVTSFSQSVLYNLINDRMMQGRETIISTNLDAARLTATYEQRISSRLLCGYTALAFLGKDIRLLKRMG